MKLCLNKQNKKNPPKKKPLFVGTILVVNKMALRGVFLHPGFMSVLRVKEYGLYVTRVANQMAS